jgi:hypothetical protein
VPYELRSEWHALDLMFSSLTLASVVTCSLGTLAILVLARKQPWPVVLVFVGVAVTCLNVYHPSFTVVRMFWAEKSGRFLVPAVALLTISAAGLALPRKIYQIFLLGSGYVCIGMYVVDWLLPAPSLEITCVVVASTVLAVLTVVAFCYFDPLRRRVPWPALAAMALLVACVVPCVQAGRDRLRVAAFSESVVLHDVPRDWTPAMAPLEAEAGDKIIAVTAGPTAIAHCWFVYPFLGSRLENQICYVSPTHTGEIVPQHPRFKNDAALDFPAWLRRLQDRGVTHVMSFAPRTAELPWMEAHPDRFQRLAGDQKTWGFYRLKRPGPGGIQRPLVTGTGTPLY